MSINMYDTRVMLQALEQMPSAPAFLRDTFFRNVRTFDTDTVDIDIVKGKRRVATYVSPVEQGKLVTRDGFTTYSYKNPYIKHKMPTTSADLLKRGAGENVYAAKSPAQRAAEQLGKDLSQLDDMITRAEELQAAQALFTGQVILRDANDALVFPMSSTHKVTLTSTDLWTDAASKPLAKLRAFRRTIQQDSGLNPTDIIMGTSALEAFLAHADVKDGKGAVSSIKVDLGQIVPQNLPGGVTYWGYLRDLGCDLWTYDNWYLGADGTTESAYVPTDKILMISREARMDRLYAVIQDLKALYAVPRFPKTWEEEDPSVRMLMLQSAPLLVPHQVDGFLFAKVV